MGNKMGQKKVIVIGAGPAGLTAAYELSKNSDYDVVVLEALGQVGGISKTINHNGNRMDIGGHRFFSKNEQVVDWWLDILNIQGEPSYDDRLLHDVTKEFVQGGPDPEKTDEVMLLRRRVSRIYYQKKFFDYPISLKFQTIANIGFIKTIKVGFSYLKSTLIKRKPENSLEDFMVNRFGYELYQMFFEDYTEKVWGRHPSQISADWGKQRIKGLSIREILKDMLGNIFKKQRSEKEVQTSLIQQFYYPKHGPGQLWECVAEKIKQNNGSIHMNKTAAKINVSASEIVSVTCDDGTVYEGDIFISTMAVKDLVAGMPEDEVEESVRQTADALPYRDFITVGLLVDKLKIKNHSKIETLNNIVPDCWIYIQEKNVKIGRLQIFNNWSPYMVEDIENTVWIGLEYFCDDGDDLWCMKDEDFIEFSANELNDIGIIDKKDIIDSVRVNVKKAYPAYFGSYSDFGKVRKHLDSYKNLYCIGRNGQHRYNNMDHSMLTAFYTVEDILSGGALGKERIWNVNAESEYHEEK
jgi:protoporphyrinogen oxidase